MKRLGVGIHRRRMLLCKVASGREYRTAARNQKDLKGPPAGYDSVHGEAGHAGGGLNYDEMVVYQEEAILPYAIVEYVFEKKM